MCHTILGTLFGLWFGLGLYALALQGSVGREPGKPEPESPEARAKREAFEARQRAERDWDWKTRSYKSKRPEG